MRKNDDFIKTRRSMNETKKRRQIIEIGKTNNKIEFQIHVEIGQCELILIESNSSLWDRCEKQDNRLYRILNAQNRFSFCSRFFYLFFSPSLHHKLNFWKGDFRGEGEVSMAVVI